MVSFQEICHIGNNFLGAATILDVYAERAIIFQSTVGDIRGTLVVRWTTGLLAYRSTIDRVSGA